MYHVTQRKRHDWLLCNLVHSPAGRTNQSTTTSTTTTKDEDSGKKGNNADPQPLASDESLVNRSDLAALESERDRHCLTPAHRSGRSLRQPFWKVFRRNFSFIHCWLTRKTELWLRRYILELGRANWLDWKSAVSFICMLSNVSIRLEIIIYVYI